jgi:chromosome segregation ATPase
MNKTFRFCTVFLLAATFGALTARGAAAQTANPDAATMQALLAEVRQLRLTVERTLSLGPRMQLLLQRAQFQDQKVSRISQQLDEVRKQIAAETARQASVNERLIKIEQDISAESDPGRRAQLEDMRGGLKMIAGNGPDQQFRVRESELSNALAVEQAALTDYNEKLDGLERQLQALTAAGQR